MHDRGLSEADARARVAAQLPSAEKERLADWIIDGEAAWPDSRRQVERVWRLLQGQAS
jgi:dephospho-CoA kinase